MSDYLPEEILTKILVKLPVKSLIRGTSVCKEWRSLIRSPSFISAHLSLTENRALLFDHEHYTVIPKLGPLVLNSDSGLEFPFECKNWYSKVVGSSDGLVCLSDDSRRIIIWNPAIRDYVVLPQPRVKGPPQHVLLGFAAANNVYKVVRLLYGGAEVFCLGSTGTRWRDVVRATGFDTYVQMNDINLIKNPIFFKGFLHWTVCEPMNVRYSIFRFHVGDEVFGETMMPEKLERKSLETFSLDIMGESLGAINYNQQFGYLRYDVWLMREYGVKESWTKLYRIDAKLGRVIGFRGSDEALLVRQCELVTYNVETKGIKRVGVFGKELPFYVNDYKESLVSLGGGYGGDSGRNDVE